jgi:hypothetical protein
VTDSARWLAERLADAPPALRARVEAALDAARGAGVRRAASSVKRDADAVQRAAYSVQRAFEEELRAVAEDLLAAAKVGPPTHETALTLLAADALITLACEWVGETEPRPPLPPGRGAAGRCRD